jgi:hypothetical protein
MKSILCLLLLIASVLPSRAGADSLTLYLDGALVEREFAAKNGIVEVVLPPSMVARSLRVKPFGDSSVTGVDIIPSRNDQGGRKELVLLEERKKDLENRLESLEEREKIFLTAVKTQSSRALRKTKNNPDPVATARQGTDLALSKLDAVQAAKWKTEKEIASIESRISGLENKEHVSGGQARIKVSRNNARVSVAYLDTNVKWIPAYDFRVEEQGFVKISLRVNIRGANGLKSATALACSMEEAEEYRDAAYVVSRNGSPVDSFHFVLTKENFKNGPVRSALFSFNNSSAKKLPAGDASGYLRNEFLGQSTFEGCKPGESATIQFGEK